LKSKVWSLTSQRKIDLSAAWDESKESLFRKVGIVGMAAKVKPSDKEICCIDDGSFPVKV
jgi:hypothetical protein